MISQQPKTPENQTLLILCINHPKTIHKLHGILKRFAMGSDGDKNSTSSLYSKTTKTRKCFDVKNVKMTKRSYAYKGYTSLIMLKF